MGNRSTTRQPRELWRLQEARLSTTAAMMLRSSNRVIRRSSMRDAISNTSLTQGRPTDQRDYEHGRFYALSGTSLNSSSGASSAGPSMPRLVPLLQRSAPLLLGVLSLAWHGSQLRPQ